MSDFSSTTCPHGLDTRLVRCRLCDPDAISDWQRYYQDEIERLRAEVAALREDAERLDFVDTLRKFDLDAANTHVSKGWQFDMFTLETQHRRVRNVREAIDAVIRARAGEAT